MIIYWIIAVALALSAALLATWPLWRGRAQPAPSLATGNVVVGPRRTALAVALAIAVMAVLLYVALGNPAAIVPQPSGAPHGIGQQQVNAMIVKLVARVDKNPQDLTGWTMLARAQTVLGKYDDARATYAQAVRLFPENAQLLADYADVLAMAQGGRLVGVPEQLVARALAIDPDNLKALALAGTIAFDNKDFARAVAHWVRLRDAIPVDSEFTQSIEANIMEANKLLQAKASAPAGLAAQ